MTNQFPREPGMKPTEGEEPQVDAAARLAGMSRGPSLSIYTRRDGSAPGAAAAVPAAEPASSIGRLTRVPATALWPDGAGMAHWLASNPAALMDAVNVDVASFEAPDGTVVLGTAKTGGPVCVVCQVGPTTDEGLGVLLRVAAVQDGGTVLWMTGEPADTHVAALSWLNRATTPRFSLVRVTGVQIDGSASAPIFTLVVRPPRAEGDGAAPSPTTPKRRVDDHLPEG
ncbi:MAG TPA: hypothetical protein VF365_02180 [Candidatus Limnocylindria bacterium]